jgi:hypothetical protein
MKKQAGNVTAKVVKPNRLAPVLTTTSNRGTALGKRKESRIIERTPHVHKISHISFASSLFLVCIPGNAFSGRAYWSNFFRDRRRAVHVLVNAGKLSPHGAHGDFTELFTSIPPATNARSTSCDSLE